MDECHLAIGCNVYTVEDLVVMVRLSPHHFQLFLRTVDKNSEVEAWTTLKVVPESCAYIGAKGMHWIETTRFQTSLLYKEPRGGCSDRHQTVPKS